MAQNIKVQDGIVVYSTSNPSAPTLSPNTPTGDIDFLINGQLGVSLELSVGNDPLADGLMSSPPGTDIIITPGKDLKIQTPTGDIVLNNVVWPLTTPVSGMFLGTAGLNVLEFYAFILGTEGSDVLSNAYLNATYPAATVGQMVLGPTVIYLFIGSGIWRTLVASTNITDPMPPYYIAFGDTYTVNEYKQVLYSMTIEVDGSLEVNGFLIEV